MGKSGFVISVGLENVGIARSTRSAGSATSMSATDGCGICAMPLAAGEDESPAAADADGEELGEGFEQPATTNTARMAADLPARRFMSVARLAVVGAGIAGAVVIG